MVAAAALHEPRHRRRVRHPDHLGGDLGDVARGGHRGGPGRAVPGDAPAVARRGPPGCAAGSGVTSWTRWQAGGETSREARWPGSTTRTGMKGPPGWGGAGQAAAGQAASGQAAAGPAAAGPAEAAAGAAGPLPGHVRIAIIGAGLGGIGAGIRLRQAGMTSFVILERATAVGGTWRDNTYPGCACDVPSHPYSFSFAPKPDWSHSFSRQPEIWRYVEDVTDRHGLRGHLAFGTEVIRADWDAGTARWRLRTSRGDLTADMLI